MEVLIYLALGVLIAPYVLMTIAAIKMRIEYVKSQSK